MLKAASLARGHSGVRPVVIESLLALANHGVLPVIPSKGSVGASGDLAPLAHLTAALIGIGEVTVGGKTVPAAEGLAAAGLQPLVLEAKEGLALLNGTQVSTALALQGLFAAEDCIAAALVAGSLSVDAARGSDVPFDPRIHELRGQPGQIDVARLLRRLLSGSAIRQSHLTGDERVQDPYSLRCQPQVMGACLDHLRFAADRAGAGGQRRHRQPAGLSRERRHPVRRQLPRRAGRHGLRHAGAGTGRNRGAVGAPDRPC